MRQSKPLLNLLFKVIGQPRPKMKKTGLNIIQNNRLIDVLTSIGVFNCLIYSLLYWCCYLVNYMPIKKYLGRILS